MGALRPGTTPSLTAWAHSGLPTTTSSAAGTAVMYRRFSARAQTRKCSRPSGLATSSTSSRSRRADTRQRSTSRKAGLAATPPARGGPGSRVFDVFINHEMALPNFDMLREGRANQLITKTFRHLQPDLNGQLRFTFTPRVNYASFRGVEISQDP